MLMRENKGFFSFAFDSAHVKYGVCTWSYFCRKYAPILNHLGRNFKNFLRWQELRKKIQALRCYQCPSFLKFVRSALLAYGKHFSSGKKVETKSQITLHVVQSCSHNESSEFSGTEHKVR